MPSWLPVVLSAWLSAAAPAPPTEAPSVAPAAALPSLAVGVGLTALWSEGGEQVLFGPDAASTGAGEPLVAGQPVEAGTLVVVPAYGRVAFLGGDLQLVTGSGPASYRWTGDALITIAGSAPVATHIAGYREGPRMPLPPIATPAPDEGESRNIGLAFVSPAATVLRDRSPVLRWRWSEPDARFDVTLLRADGAGAGTVVERWQALAGRSLVLWGPLDRGGRYRAIISLHGASALARVVSDEVAFAVLDGADAAALDEALAGLRAAATRAGGERPELQVLRARVFESYGLLAEAERAWAALALLYPERAELNAQARRLAREVRLR